MKRLLSYLGSLALGVAPVLFVAGPVLADIPDNLTDIPNRSTDSGSRQLRNRGYTFIDSDWHNGKLHEYWWNARENTCIHARADNGAYEAVMYAGANDCNQYHEEATKSDDKAGAAIAAAAIIGAIALAHKSHHRQDDQGNDNYAGNEHGMAEFDRGYRDGLHHDGYHNWNNTSAYSDGYHQGQVQREENQPHRRHREGSIPPPSVDINRQDDAATVRFRGGCEVLFAPNGQMTKWSSFCTGQEKNAATRAYDAARREKNAGPDAYRDI